ncbi:transposase [Qipengyuania gelatinilytica]|uniref:Transposase n=1 Tax=Qipengyuania gelatinilytica TaxID=2867231 RepID=A0ABX9A3S0_9SPHN|nr:transposase [Qipengyuania gelatinilytica]QZD95912.1 transposase [Qipengyuania gelatinilytica]
MPRIIPSDETAAHGLEDCLEMLDAVPFEPEDESSLANGAVALKRLANNRDFLSDLLIEQLKVGHKDGGIESAYGPQSIVLSRMRGRSFLRANIWPSEQESCFRASGADAFVYGVPHDHNFSFLTAGYFGPGYSSDYYEYDYESVAGYRGEVCDLRFVERTQLEEGKLMLYRANLDIHSQLPPESMSVSLNIMHIDPAQAWSDQYGFDLDSNAVTGVLNPTSTECFLRCAVGMGGEEALDFAKWAGREHPSDRLRLASFEARSGLLSGSERDQLWREAELSGSVMLAKEAAEKRRRIERAYQSA